MDVKANHSIMATNVIAGYTEDSELVKACLDGNDSAWRALVNRYSRLVYSIPRSYRLSIEDSEDIFQNVFTNVARHLPSLRDQKLLAAWLITITQRECQRMFKSHSARLVELSEFTVGKSTEDSGSPLIDQAETWERQHLVRQALLQLDPKCRELVTSLFIDPQNPSYQQIASSLNIPLGSIGPSRARCLKRLEAILIAMGVRFD